MPYKRKTVSPYYYIRIRTLPGGYGNFGPVSTKTTDYKLACRYDQLVRDIAEKALIVEEYRKLIEALDNATVDFGKAYSYFKEGQLENLITNLHDPNLHECLMESYEIENDRTTKIGFKELVAMTPKSARLSFFKNSKTLTEFLVRIENGDLPNRNPIKRNSVYRRHKRAISKMLRHHLGEFKRNQIFSEVKFAPEDDTRRVFLNSAQITDLLSASNGEFRTAIRLAMETGMDRGPIFKLEVRDVVIEHLPKSDEYQGTIYVNDKKTDTRSRTLGVTGILAYDLALLAQGKKGDERVLNITSNQLDYRWKRIKHDSLGDMDFRFKDLRHVFIASCQRAGLHLPQVKAAAGHSRIEQTARYMDEISVFTAEQSKKVREAMMNNYIEPMIEENLTINPTISGDLKRAVNE